jgi:ribonuclease BN (tRNA processing enzyme)
MERMSLELTILGCSGSGPAPGNPASGYLVRSASTSVWLDTGPGTFMALGEHIDPAQVDAVTISHLHADHSSDFLGFSHYIAYRNTPPRPIPVFLPPGGVATFAAYLGAGPGHAFFDVFDLEELAGPAERRVGDITLTFAPAEHSVPTNAVRCESGQRTLTFSGDTGPGGGFAALATGSHVVLSEAGLNPPSPGEGPQHHLSGSDAGRIARVAGAGRLILTHLAPTLRAEDIHAAAAAEFPGEILLAEPGMVVAI